MKKGICILMSWIILCVVAIPCYAEEETAYVWSSNANAIEENTTVETAAEATTENPLQLTCGGAILIEQHSGEILYEHNIHEQLRPASVTKIMSILLIMEALDNGSISLEDKVPCSENAASMGGSQIWLNTTEELTVHEMLKAICVVSANE